MTCKKCGTEFNTNFCPNCGEKAEIVAEPTRSEIVESTSPLGEGSTAVQVEDCTRDIFVKRLVKLTLLGFMVCFIFPFFTVSCQAQEIQTSTGQDLMLGFEFMKESVKPNVIIVCAFLFALAGLLHTIFRSKHGPTMICSLLSSACLILHRLGIYRNLADEASAEGYNLNVISIQYHTAWYVAVILGIVAVLLPFVFKKFCMDWGTPRSNINLQAISRGVLISSIILAVLVGASFIERALPNRKTTTQSEAAQKMQKQDLDQEIQDAVNKAVNDALSSVGSEESTQNPVEVPEQETTQSQIQTPPPPLEETPKESQEDDDWVSDEVYDDSDWLFPSDIMYISEEDMMYWDEETTALARNEIFARHGYIFNNQAIQRYFNFQSWYVPDPDFNGDGLSNIEKVNVETIKAFEQARGWR